jgi:hypothetical protein
MPPQCPPVGSFYIQNGATDILRLISVSTTTLTTNPTFAWQNSKENWFSPKNLDLNTTLAAASSITLKLNHHSATTPSIDASIQATGDALANTANWTFQLYAKGTLASGDWVSGVPTYGTKAYYFEESSASNTRPRLLFDVDASDTKKLVKMVWYCPVNTVTAYLAGAADGTTITLAKLALTNVPTTGYHYKP